MSESLRCPGCRSAILNTLEIQVQTTERKRQGVDAKICRHCDIIIPLTKKIKFWDGVEVISQQ